MTPTPDPTTTTAQFFACEGVTEDGHPWSYHGPDPAVCSTTEPPPTELAATGVNSGLVLAGGGLLLLGALLVVASRKFRSNGDQ